MNGWPLINIFTTKQHCSPSLLMVDWIYWIEFLSVCSSSLNLCSSSFRFFIHMDHLTIFLSLLTSKNISSWSFVITLVFTNLKLWLKRGRPLLNHLLARTKIIISWFNQGFYTPASQQNESYMSSCKERTSVWWWDADQQGVAGLQAKTINDGETLNIRYHNTNSMQVDQIPAGIEVLTAIGWVKITPQSEKPYVSWIAHTLGS